jgi:hypothetical protein
MKRFGYTLAVIIVLLANSSGALAQFIHVDSAYYGTSSYSRNVRKRVQRFADFGEPFRVSNDTLRIDPVPGKRKMLVVVYRVEGRRITDRVLEGDVFYFRSSEYADAGPGYKARLRIVDATYGAKGRYLTVTRIVRHFAWTRQPFEVSNRTFGADPFPGVPKRLKIVYLQHRTRRTHVCREGDVVRF